MLNHFLSNAKIGEDFSTSLGPLQVRFIKRLRGNVKDIIRLVKQWKKENELEIPSYCLELLTVKVWRDMGGTRKHPRPAPTAEIFKNIIKMLANLDKIQIAFGTNYSVTEYTKSLTPPYILDPANPNKDTLTKVKERQRKKIIAAANEACDILHLVRHANRD